MNYFVDIGVYETLVITSEKEKITENEMTQVFPNPFTSEVIVAFNLKEYQLVKIFILDSHGNLITEFMNTPLIQGRHTYQFSIPGNLSNTPADGVYYLELIKGQREETI